MKRTISENNGQEHDAVPRFSFANGSQQRSGTTKTLLLIEDDIDQRELFATLLQSAGYDIVSVSSAELALCVLEQRTIHGVVSDVALPGLDGAELLTRVRNGENGVQIPIIMVTASREDLKNQLLSNGADSFCLKRDAFRMLIPKITELVG